MRLIKNTKMFKNFFEAVRNAKITVVKQMINENTYSLYRKQLPQPDGTRISSIV